MERRGEQWFVVTDHKYLTIVNQINFIVCWLKHYTTEVAKHIMSIALAN